MNLIFSIIGGLVGSLLCCTGDLLFDLILVVFGFYAIADMIREKIYRW